MIRNTIIALLIVAVAGTGYWGYQEHKEKTAILVQAENTYQRAFHDLNYQVDLLHDKIGTTLAMNSRTSLSPALTDVWRITSEAQNDVGQLPLTLIPFNKTEEFLSKIGDFSYRTAVRDLEKEPLNDQEYANLKSLYKQSSEIQDELRKVQHLVIKNNLRWMDVEAAVANHDEKSDNTIIDGFKTVEKKVAGFTEANAEDPTILSVNQKDATYQNLQGKVITKKEAVEIAKEYAHFQGEVITRVEENGKGSDFGFYSVSLVEKATNNEVNTDITKKGGYPIWYINNRQIKEKNLSLNDAYMEAEKFLKEHKFKSLELFESSQYNHVGLFTFVTTVDHVRVYPDTIKVKVAMDDGTIIGFAAEEYLKSHKLRQIGESKLSQAEAEKKLNPNVKIMESRKAVIINDINEEVLCYEFLGVIDNDTYRIFINANNGNEEKVEKLRNSERVYE